jgi:hypothetical protein
VRQNSFYLGNFKIEKFSFLIWPTALFVLFHYKAAQKSKGSFFLKKISKNFFCRFKMFNLRTKNSKA